MIFRRIAATTVVVWSVATIVTVVTADNARSIMTMSDQQQQAIHQDHTANLLDEIVIQEQKIAFPLYRERHLDVGNEEGDMRNGNASGEGKDGDFEVDEDNGTKSKAVEEVGKTDKGEGKGAATSQEKSSNKKNQGSDESTPIDGAVDEETEEPVDPPVPPSSPPVELPSPAEKGMEDPCEDAKSCEECHDKAFELIDTEDTCRWVSEGDAGVGCHKEKANTIADGECSEITRDDSGGGGGDNADGAGGNDGGVKGGEDNSGASEENKGDTKMTNPPSSPSLELPDDDKSPVGIIIGLLLLLGCGGAVWKTKHLILDKVDMPASMGGIPSARTAKYREVAVEEQDDEEWGWGDDDGSGDVELAASSKDDSSVHKRRTSSHESLPNTPLKLSPTPFRKSSPRVNSHGKSHSSTDNYPHIPKLIAKAPAPSPVVIHGMSLSKPSIPSSGGIHRTTSGSRPGMSLSAVKTPTPVASAPSSVPMLSTEDFSNMQGIKITSLGPKRKPAATPKAPAPAPSSAEDDIFASMGLSAMPTFSHAQPAPVKAMAPASLGSRWGAATPTTLGAAAPTSTVTATATSNNFAASGDDEANWDDDGDLDDLLDD